jgi:uncharacterized protein with HEPN domain
VKDEGVYLKHIHECIRRIEEDTRDGRETFLRTHTLQDAVLRNLQILSESTQRLSDGSKVKHPEIEWRRIAAFRNFLVHDYLGVDMERIWEIVQRDVPVLKRVVSELFREVEGRAL